VLVAKARVTLEVGKMGDAEAELRRALDLAAQADDDATRAEATRSLGWALTAMSRFDEATEVLERARDMHRKQGSARGEADAHVALGILAAFSGKPDDALHRLREALAIHVERGDVVRQEKVLGFAPLVGQDAREVARGLPREVLARAPEASLDRLPDHVAAIVATEREAGERWRHAIALYRDGVAAHARGDHAAAVDAFDRALAALGRAGVTRGSAIVHAHAAVALADAGDLAEAEARLTRAEQTTKDDPASALAVALHSASVALRRAQNSETKAAAKAALERVTRAEAIPPDVVIARRVLEVHLETAAEAAGPRSVALAPALTVGRDSRWMVAAGGERVDLVRYGPVRRLLERLVEERLTRPAQALSAEQLIEAGWPGERMRHSAGLLRVYSAIRRLRRLGLEPLLITRDDGYLLDANAIVTRDES
jgi:tetratricopeptide (TPR) repeat protein